MLESLLVGLIVAVAAVYAVWVLMPVVARRSLALRGARALGAVEARGWRARVAAWLLRLAQAGRGGCSDCPAATLTPAERARQRRD